MKVIIAGGRDFEGGKKHRKWLKEQLQDLQATYVLSGCARGADAFGEEVAQELNIPVEIHPAAWAVHGRSAGLFRNEAMAQLADACILFPGGRGTQDMESRAIKHELVIRKWEEK